MSADTTPPTLTLVPSGNDDQDEAPRMQKRIVAIKLPGEYAGFSVSCWINFPPSMMTDMTRLARAGQRKAAIRQAEYARLLADDPTADEPEEDTTEQGALAQIMKRLIVAHNLRDFDGNPYPGADTVAFYDQAPTDLISVIFQAIQAEVGKLPKTRPLR